MTPAIGRGARGPCCRGLPGDNSEAAARLSEAYKAARDRVQLGKIRSLADAATAAERHAQAWGTYLVDGGYEPGLEPGGDCHFAA
jgi:hypothetical protein